MKLSKSLLVLVLVCVGILNAGELKFRKHVINADSKFEAAGAVDINRDGKLDIFSGGFWYEAPTWKKHFVREVQELGEYYVDFAAIPLDVDGDGWTDIVNAAWHNKAVFWTRNPGKEGKFETFIIDTPGNMETALPIDINGDGQLDILPNAVRAVVWYEFKPDKNAENGVKWIKHTPPQDAAAHGIGAGDVDGDGKCDIISPKGWLKQTGPKDTDWKWLPEFSLGHSPSIPILVHDVDGDGNNDIVWGHGHNYGVKWLQQKKDANGKRTWTEHLIDKSWSQPHFMLFVDLDNDGNAELLTGKRHRAHNGKDPGGTEQVCVYAYSFDKSSKKWTRHTISEGGKTGFGIYTMATDMDKDGDIDIICPGKSGLFLMENLLK